MSNYKLFIQRMGLIGITGMITSLTSFILLPILTKNLSIQDYGIWIQFNTFLGLLPFFVTLGLTYTMARFLPAEKNIEKIREGFYSIFFVILTMGLIISILIMVFSDPISFYFFNNNSIYVKILPFVFLAYVISMPCFAFFRTFQKIKRYSFLTIFHNFFTVFLVALPILIGYGVIGSIMGLFIGQITIDLILILIIFNQIGFKLPKFHNIKEYLSFGIPTLPGNLSSWMLDSSDRLLISAFLGVSFVGYYNPGYSLGNIIIIFIGPMSFLLPVSLSKTYDENKIKEVKETLEYSLKLFILVALPSVFGLSILSKPLLLVLTTTEIASQGYIITPFVALSAFFYGIYGIISNVIVLKKDTKILGSLWIFAAILNVILNVILLPYIGVIGAALTTFIAYLAVFCLVLFYTIKNFELDYNFKFIVNSLFGSIVISLFIYNVNPHGILDILLTIIISAFIYFIILILFKGIKKHEILFIKELVKR